MIMFNFNTYVSNTSAGTCNNFIIRDTISQPKTARIFYKVCNLGYFSYCFCFSNFVDSTYGDGSECHANVAGGEWNILSAAAGDGGEYGKFPEELSLTPVLFLGESGKKVSSGEIFSSDEIGLEIKENHYLCFEITFTGSDIPYTPDKIIPAFSRCESGFIPDKEFPQPVLVGCQRTVGTRVAFLGDSITQGLGTEADRYEYWVAEISRRLGADCSVWNLGLGCGRAEDAATDSVWLEKAKQMDVVFVCFGVNDILQGRSADQICKDLTGIVDLLKAAGCKVGILSVPPFDMEGDNGVVWYGVNDYIREVLSHKTDWYFDTTAVLGKPAPERHMSCYGGHPDGTGGRLLGEAFCREIAIGKGESDNEL